MSPSMTDVEEIVDMACQMVELAAMKKNITILRNSGDERCCADSRWTAEALGNVLDNAVKYTGRGGRIGLSVRKGEIFAEIHVKDTGKGIPLERQAEIFTRFYREPEVHDVEGIGIGLYLTRRITELQGGYVEVRSCPGKGADFTIYLPL